MSVNDKMTAMADNIRHLMGIGKPLTLDEMTAHIKTERDNVDAAFEAFAARGANVPKDADSGDLAAMAAQITDTALVIESGQFTADATTKTISHTLGVTPVFAILSHQQGSKTLAASDMFVLAAGVSGYGMLSAGFDYSSSTTRYLRWSKYSEGITGSSGPIRNATEDEITFGYSTSYTQLKSGEVYLYVLGALKGGEEGA